MPLTFEQSQTAIARLVKHFATNQAQYRAPAYKEAQARQEFIDPFFAALNWDVYNAQHAAPDYREVVFEDSLEIEGQRKAPDYVFRVGQKRMFFVEAKKPGVDLKNASAPAYQLRRYAWSAKLPLSLLTDFEELAVYDCRQRPAEKDKPTLGRINYLPCAEYADRWREVWDVFSREAVWGGSFDHYAHESKTKRGTSEVDAEFLKEIEGWREALAKNIALRNPRLTIDELNDAVQRTIDRVIFLRMAEDRGIEPYGQLQQIATAEDAYPALIALARKADAKYNSGLFDFSKKGDQVTPRLTVDDKALRPILAGLYYPQSPYEFSVLPAEILGNVYEQFLGKVIRLTPAHQAKVEEKPEVKKAGGVYYTPAYIVDYIVKQTLGAQIAGKSPKQLTGFRVLDMACGSGSFLLGAYQYLLDYALTWYTTHTPEKHPQAVRPVGEGWRLTTAERKRLLTAHIFGVDIDRQAVEVTKLSLLLKVLEGEDQETLGQQLRLLQERALPNLDQNIKHGNSLIGPDYFTGQLMPSDDDLRRVNPFDWAAEFPDAMQAGGFDCVIGNPPYIRIQTLKEWAALEVEVYKQLYQAASAGNYDIYVVFVEKGLSLLSERGRLGYILPHKFFNAQYGAALRELIANGRHLAEVIHFGDQQVFAGATTYTCLLFLSRTPTPEAHIVKATDLTTWRTTGKATEGTIPAERITATEWNFTVGAGAALFEKLSQMPVKLGDLAKRIFQGFKTGADPVFILEKRSDGKYYSNALEAVVHVESKYLRPLYKSGEMKRYDLHPNLRVVIFPYRNGNIIEWNEITTSAPKLAEYLKSCKEILAKREDGRWNDQHWYCYSRTQALEIVANPKILTADLNPHANYCFDATGQACFPGGAAGGYGIILDEKMYLYVLGLLNSKAVDYYHKQISTNFRGGWYGYDAKIIRNIPIRPINFSDPADKAHHNRMVKLVEQMLDLHQRHARAQDATAQAQLQRLITATDQQIDTLVYELYGLTPEEIAVVEQGR